jgi:bifunctional UDP-N-acetylglucosamine pyrophosphorylase/glucosamine-1-phosphate N-acetyltransferase
MKAIMFAAGKSTRTLPLTEKRPKPLLKLLDRTIIDHNLTQLKGLIDKITIVVGYKKDMIIEYLSEKDYGFDISFVEQKEQLGTGHALLQCEKELKDEKRFMVISGDDIYSRKEISNP